jgi:hypothetical protein
MIDHNSYITDSWNKLDFLIVMFSIIDMANTGQDLSYIKVNYYLKDYPVVENSETPKVHQSQRQYEVDCQ